jgi:hypothetical protein
MHPAGPAVGGTTGFKAASEIVMCFGLGSGGDSRAGDRQGDETYGDKLTSAHHHGRDPFERSAAMSDMHDRGWDISSGLITANFPNS